MLAFEQRLSERALEVSILASLLPWAPMLFRFSSSVILISNMGQFQAQEWSEGELSYSDNRNVLGLERKHRPRCAREAPSNLVIKVSSLFKASSANVIA
jgi:hypothetical protein